MSYSTFICIKISSHIISKHDIKYSSQIISSYLMTELNCYAVFLILVSRDLSYITDSWDRSRTATKPLQLSHIFHFNQTMMEHVTFHIKTSKTILWVTI